MRVLADQGDSVDALCYRHLGGTEAVESVLRENPGLAALGTILPMGTAVTLPDTAARPRSRPLIQLWD